MNFIVLIFVLLTMESNVNDIYNINKGLNKYYIIFYIINQAEDYFSLYFRIIFLLNNDIN